jgi:hypothetical protein
MRKIIGAKVRTLCQLKNKGGIIIEKGEVCTIVQSYRGYGIRTDDYRQINRVDKSQIDFIKPLKAKKIVVTPDEYKAIQFALSEVEVSVGYGDLSEEQSELYKANEVLLHNLLDKINNA